MKKIFILLIAICISVGAWAQEFNVDGIWYNVTNATGLTVEVYGSDYSNNLIVIPVNVTNPADGKEYTVSSIRDYAFYNNGDLTDVTIPNSVISISDGAFYGCIKLTSVTIGNSVTNIGGNAFGECTSLTSITIPNSVVDVGVGAFWRCTSLASITLPNSVTNIGGNAFDGCTSLTSIAIPSSVLNIGGAAFYGCNNLTTINADELNPNFSSVNGVLYNKEKTNLVAYPSGNKNTEFIIPNSITSIGNVALGACNNLTSISIPNSVISIGDEAFYGCSSLTSITIPTSVTNIGRNAFSECRNLTEAIIENNNPPIISDDTFDGNITTITVPQDSKDNYALTNWSKYLLKEVGEEGIGNIFSATNNYGTELYYRVVSVSPNKVEVTYSPNTYTGSINIPTNVTNDGDTYEVTGIVEKAFANCDELISITIPNSIATLNKEVFLGCVKLTSITIPNSVTSIGDKAFAICSGLTSVTIPNSVTSIGVDVFFGCSSLISINIPNSVTSIGNGAFSSCSGLTSITIPNSVTSIGKSAFMGCKGLTSITIPNSVTSIAEGAFNNCRGLTSVTIPNSVTKIEGWAFNFCSSLTSITIPNSVTSIGERAFTGCDALTTITIPNSITSIGNNAFTGCDEVIIENSTPPSIGTYVFSYEANIIVPRGSLSNYKSFYAWSEYNIQEAETVTPGVVFTAMHNGIEIYYGVTSMLPTKTVEVLPNPNKYSGNLTIPATVYFEYDDYNVTNISKSAFSGNYELNSIVLPNSVTSINDYAFYFCDGLTFVTMGNSVTNIGKSAFRYCSSLTDIAIPNSVVSISESAFRDCYSLTDVTIPNSVTNIDAWAFAACDALTSVTIGSSVTNIGDKAFTNCFNLTDVTNMATTPPSTGNNNAFSNLDLASIALNIPSGTSALYEAAPEWQYFGTIVDLAPAIGQTFSLAIDNQTLMFSITNLEPSTVEVVGNTTKNTSSVYTGVVNIPSAVSYQDVEFTVTSIAPNTFSNSSITEVTIPSTVTNIGYGAFSNCTDLTKITTAATTLPTMGNDVFSGVAASNVELVVPSGTKETYNEAAQWNIFASQTTEDPALGIVRNQATQPFTQQGSTLVFEQETNIAVYRLSGACVYKGITQSYTLPQKGMFVVVTNGNAFKVISR